MEFGAYYLRAEQEGTGPYYSRSFSIEGGPPNTLSFSGFLSATASITQATGSPAPPADSAAPNSTKDNGLSTGAKAGIAVGAVIAAVILALLTFLLGKRAGRKSRLKPEPISKNEHSSVESQQQPMYRDTAEAELEQEKRYVELDSQRAPQEVQGNIRSSANTWQPA